MPPSVFAQRRHAAALKAPLIPDEHPGLNELRAMGAAYERLHDDPELARRLNAASKWEVRLVQCTFLLLGSASAVTLSTVCLAAAYFKDTLGDGVVSQFILAHTSVLLIVMVGVLAGRPGKTSLSTTAALLTAATLFGVGFNVFVLASVLVGEPPSAHVLFPLVALNGGAAGLIQSLSPRLGGDLPTTRSTAVGSLQLVGVSLAQWLPSVIQAALLPLAALDPHTTAGLAAVVSLGGAAALCLGAFVCLRLLLVQCRETIAAVADEPQLGMTIGTATSTPSGRDFVWNRRVLWLLPICLLTFSAEAAITFLVVVSPRLPVVADSAFWQTYQVTLLLSSTNTFAFFGRSAGLRTTAEEGVTIRLLWWWSLTPLAAGITFAYWRHVVSGTTVALLALYSLTALANGFALVLLNKTAQATLEPYASGDAHAVESKPCPIAAQLMWLSIQTGAFAMSVAGSLFV